MILFAVLLCSVLVLATADDSAASPVDEFEFEGINYIVTSEDAFGDFDGTVKVGINDTALGDLIIPDQVTADLKTYSVTAIGDAAFKNSGITSVVIPNSVTSIDGRAFKDSDITSVIIPNSVTSIGDEAFQWAVSLTSVVIPDSVTFIGDVAFMATGLTSVTIPGSVTSIGIAAFVMCPIESFVVSPDNDNYSNDDQGILYNKDKTILIQCPGAFIGEVEIPNTVKTIGMGAFAYCPVLTSVIISTSVDSISDQAFTESGLISIVIPDSVTSIGEKAFFGCSDLTSVTISNSVTSINKSTFEESGLTSVVIPDSVTSIDDRAFYGSKLTHVVIPNSVTSIGNMAFVGTNITSVTIPESVTSIGIVPFAMCPIVSFEVSVDNAIYSNDDRGILYNKDKTVLIECPGAFTGKVEIPETVTSIGECAFAVCSSLTSVNIPNSVTSIGDAAFEGCFGLESVTIPNSVTFIGGSAFSGIKFYYADGVTEIIDLVAANLSGHAYAGVGDAKLIQKIVVIFKNEGITIQTTEVAYGAEIIAPDNFKKESDAEFDYIFGWELSPEGSGIFLGDNGTATDDAIYNAKFTPKTREYTITWKVEGSDDVTKEVAFGTVPTFDGTPTRDATAQYTYTFANWDVIPVAVNGPATYIAEFSKVTNEYTITWIVDGITTNKTTQVAYGVIPSYGVNPTKAATAQFTYTFVNFVDASDAEPVAVTGLATYTAQFSKTTNEYTITWIIDGAIVVDYTQVADYGTAIIVPATPTKPATVQYEMQISIWAAETGYEGDMLTITGDVKFNAVFDLTVLNQYTVTWEVDGAIVIANTQTADYGTTMIVPATPTKPATVQYEIQTSTWVASSGYTGDMLTISGDVKFTAIYDALVLNQYTVTWEVDGAIVTANTQTADYGTEMIVPATPTKPATVQYKIQTSTWVASSGYTGDMLTISGDVKFTAIYDALVLNQYTVTWIVDGIETNKIEQLAYGATPSYGVAPTKTVTTQYTFGFAGWDPAVVNVIGDATYTAVFDETLRTYATVPSTEILNDLIDQNGNPMLQLTDALGTIDNSVFQNLGDKSFVINVMKEDKVAYSWTFSGDYKADEGTIFNASISEPTPGEDLNAAIDSVNVESSLVLKFEASGELPADASVKYYVGDNYEEGTELSLFLYNEVTKKLDDQSKKVIVDAEGYVTFSLEHCSFYVLAEISPDAPVAEIGDEFVFDGINYVITSKDAFDTFNGTVKVGMNQSFSGDLTIPAQVTNGDPVKTYSVTAIGDAAFKNSGITSVVIPNSVTSIDGRAFKDSDITSVIIPNSVTSIGDEAFQWAVSLTSVDIPNSVISIGEVAFMNTALTSVTIPESVTSIGIAAFVMCPIESFVVSPDNDNYSNDDQGILYNKDKTILIQCPGAFNGEVEIPDTVITIEMGAFAYCPVLTSVIIPDSVTSINDQAFTESGLISIVIPDSVTSIGEKAFFGCSNLTSVTISNSVTSINKSTFEESGLTSVVIPDSVTSIGYRAFYGSKLTHVVIPESVITIGLEAFAMCPIVSFVVSPDNASYSNDDQGILYNKDQTVLIECPGAFTGKVEIPDTVTSISEGAFAVCSGLTSVNIPEGVTSIGDMAFVDTNITSVTIPESVTSIGVAVFAMCPIVSFVVSLDNASYSNDDQGILYNKDQTVLIECPGAFTGKVEIPDTVTSIGDYAFVVCSDLTSVNIPEGVTSIGESAFEGCMGLESVTIPNSVTFIGNYAFSGIKFYDADGVTEITDLDAANLAGHAYTGVGDAKLIQVAVVDDQFEFEGINYVVTSEVAFGDFDGTVEVGINIAASGDLIIPDQVIVDLKTYSVTAIGDSAFKNSGISSVVIPSSVTSIGNMAFVGTNITSVTIPESVTSIGVAVFAMCPIVSFVVSPDNASYSNDDQGILYNKDQTVLVECPGAFIGEVEIPDTVTSIGEGAFAVCSGLTSVNIPEGVTSIGPSAFEGCIGLEAVTIPNSVTFIGDHAFSGIEFYDADGVIEITDLDAANLAGHAYTGVGDAKLIQNSVVIFKNGGATVQTTEVAYGAEIIAPEDPEKASDVQFNYNFFGWELSPEGSEIFFADHDTAAGDVTYYAKFASEIREYIITWNVYGTETTSTVAYGVMPSYGEDNPVRAATDEFTYTFDGWEPAVIDVVGDAIYTAKFSEETNKYTITWIVDGITENKTDTLAYGATPDYGVAPTKEATAQYTFGFTVWSPTVVNVIGNAEYTAQFSETLNKYTITWKVEGSDDVTKEVAYGIVPTFDGTPTKDATAQYTYTFANWNVTPIAVNGPATYTAKFSEETNKYTITWIVDGITENKTDTLAYGATPDYGVAPTKEATAQYTFGFTGWSPVIVSVIGDATYTAQFSKTTNEYTVTWIVDGITTNKTTQVAYGVIPSYGVNPTKAATAHYTYTFDKFVDASGAEPVAVTGPATYTATFYSVLEVDADATGIIDNSVFLALGGDSLIINVMKDGAIVYSWTFSGAYTADATTIFNTGIVATPDAELDADLNNAINSIEIRNPLVLKFAASGILPKNASVSYNIGDKYANGTQLSLFLYDEVEMKLVDQEQIVTVINGVVTFTLEHCSFYVLAEISPEDAVANNTMLYIGIAIVAIIIAIIAIVAIRSKSRV